MWILDHHYSKLCAYEVGSPARSCTRQVSRSYLSGYQANRQSAYIRPLPRNDTILNQISSKHLFFVGQVYMSDLTNCFVWSCYSDHTSSTPTSTSSSTPSQVKPAVSQQRSICAPQVLTFPSSDLQTTCRIYKAGLLSLREVHAGSGMS